MENYRPVTVPSTFSKIFEYCFLQRLLSYLENYNLISETQHGFSSGKSTGIAMYALSNHIVHGLDAGERPVGIFCDLSRAFDCVHHDLLLEDFENIGVLGNGLNWIKSFLIGRTQYTDMTSLVNGNLRHVSSQQKTLNRGVPQGSVLGPVFFSLYVNDVDHTTPYAVFIKYTDDTSLIISGKTQEETVELCSQAFSDLNNWFSKNSLHFNIEKTFIIQIS